MVTGLFSTGRTPYDQSRAGSFPSLPASGRAARKVMPGAQGPRMARPPVLHLQRKATVRANSAEAIAAAPSPAPRGLGQRDFREMPRRPYSPVPRAIQIARAIHQTIAVYGRAMRICHLFERLAANADARGCRFASIRFRPAREYPRRGTSVAPHPAKLDDVLE
jgi:hypothetical protein